MRKILIAGESQELFLVANQISNDKSEILNLSEEKTFENLFNQLNCCDEILAISDEFCGQVNSNLVRFFEWLKTQNFALNNEKKGLDGAEKTHSVVMSIAILSFDENFNQSILSDYFSRLSKYFGIKVNLLKCFNLRQNLLNLSDNYSSLANELLSCLNAKQGQNLNPKEVVIYTDGACSGNPGAGGWGAVLLCGESKRELSGFEAETTNNRMELTAVIEALKFLKKPCKVELYSDSAYVVNAINQNWLEKWKMNGWIGSDKKIVKNIELWQKLDELLEIHEVNFNKVKGHSSVELNNKCDQLATGEIAKHSNEN